MFPADIGLRFLAACTIAQCTHIIRLRADCASSWPSFTAEHPFVSTQRVSRSRVRTKFDEHFDAKASGAQGLSAFPKERFAFCSIEKNGCSQWDTVLQKIASHKPSENVLNYYIKDQVSSPENLTKVFNDPLAVRAVMVREPLSRFASAYLDKCFSADCTNTFCFARPNSMQGKAIPFRKVLSWMMQSDPALLDGHWRLQSEHCELRTRIDEYTIIGLMRKETFAQDSHCIMEEAGLEEFDIDGDSGEPFFKESSADADSDEQEVLKKLFTPHAARSLIAHLHQDYQVFNFPPEPSWVAEATGEWFNHVPPQSCENGGLAPSAFSLVGMANRTVPKEVADDIVAMAAMAGFPVR